MAHDTLVVLDYGSQTAQLIARRVREIGVFSELLPWDTPVESVMAARPRGLILSGGPSSVYEPGAPTLPGYVIESGLPVLGICYGMQALTHALGGQVAASPGREYGPASLHTDRAGGLLWHDLPGTLDVWMSHGDRIEAPPPGFRPIGHTSGSPVAAMADPVRQIIGLQFHPEVSHTLRGRDILANFALRICGCTPDWTPGTYIDEIIASLREQVGDERVLLGLSGGVDSSVVAALLYRAIGDRLVSVFIDHGLLRKDEARQVLDTFKQTMHINVVAVDAARDFLDALAGITDPESKRKIVGELFVRTFEHVTEQIAHETGPIRFLAQGTIYPDVIESAAPDRPTAHRIKSHHNVGGLPADIRFELVEPLRYLFKDEVRRVGEALGLPDEIVWRQPFPGPGLAVRCLGEVTRQRLERLRAADAIFTGALRNAGLLRGDTAQAFAVLLPVQSVGVMGDQRTYAETIALRAVATDDFMTADWARLPAGLLAEVSTRIVNEVPGINRVVYDITTKPPATIEWE
jgi:GMP synthase (glutamine-hydrolysing)